MPQLPAAVLVLLALGMQRGAPVQVLEAEGGVRHRALARPPAAEGEAGAQQEVSYSLQLQQVRPTDARISCSRHVEKMTAVTVAMCMLCSTDCCRCKREKAGMCLSILFGITAVCTLYPMHM